jgi:hypothetical protein
LFVFEGEWPITNGRDAQPSWTHFGFVLIAITGWMNQRQLEVIDYLREENRILREQLGQGRPLALFISDGLQNINFAPKWKMRESTQRHAQTSGRSNLV